MSSRQGPQSANTNDADKSSAFVHTLGTTEAQDNERKVATKDTSMPVDYEQKDASGKLQWVEGDVKTSRPVEQTETTDAITDRRLSEDIQNIEGERVEENKTEALWVSEASADHKPLQPLSSTEPVLEHDTKLESMLTEPAIRDIMQQFGKPQEAELSNSSLEHLPARISSTMEAVQYPPRSSSLDAAGSPDKTAGLEPSQQHPLYRFDTLGGGEGEGSDLHSVDAAKGREIASNTSSRNSNLIHKRATQVSPEITPSTSGSRSIPANVNVLPDPEPNPPLSFDFHRFLDQLRHRSADPVAKYLRSFLLEFGKKQWMVHEQVKIVRDFLTFIAGKMAQGDVWRGVSDAEFDNAKEGMEKLVMNRLYSQTFSPAIESPSGKAKNGSIQPERRGQHQEDIEHDNVLAQKVRIYKWVKEEHLDIAPVGDSGKRFLLLAQQGAIPPLDTSVPKTNGDTELLKIDSYRAPRDKVICVLNCCKVIFGLLRNSSASDTSADSFMPLLIFVILKAGPDHLVSNAQYITRFRNQDKLIGESGYYVSSLLGAIQFIENLDRTSLTISDHEFEQSVEAAVSAIAEREPKGQVYFDRGADVAAKATDENPSEVHEDEKAAVAGLIRSIQKPLSSIGRIFSDEPSTLLSSSRRPDNASAPPVTPRKLSPAFSKTELGEQQTQPLERLRSPRLSEEEAAARQANAEVAEARRLSQAEHRNVVETLAGMFPSLDKDVIDDVVRLKEGRVGSAVDACLALNIDT